MPVMGTNPHNPLENPHNAASVQDSKSNSCLQLRNWFRDVSWLVESPPDTVPFHIDTFGNAISLIDRHTEDHRSAQIGLNIDRDN